MKNIFIKKNNSLTEFNIGILIFVILNILTAIFLKTHYDEVYYWMWSKQPALGYFDHPPMIAWLINLGTKIFPHQEIGLRLPGIILSAIATFLLWTTANRPKPLLFWAVFYSIVLIQPYTFIATPDAPLFFSSALFFYCYKRYLNKDNYSNILFLAFAIAMLLYSKYHGVLIIFFTVISNLKLFRKRSFWMVTLVSFIFFIPHLYWQYSNDFVSFRYHLLDSHYTPYKIGITLEYIYGQLLLFGPITGWLIFFIAFTFKTNNTFYKALKTNAIGIMVFFLISTLGGDNEAHWTLIATIPMLLLALFHFETSNKWEKLFYWGGCINFAILLVVRIIIISPLDEKISAFNLFNGWDKETEIIKQTTQSYPVLFQDSWNKVARFSWYSNDTRTAALSSGYNRNCQYDIWDTDELLKGQTVYVLTRDSTLFSDATEIQTNKQLWFAKKFDDFESYYNASFNVIDKEYKNNTLKASIEIHNPYDTTLTIDSTKYDSRFYLLKKKYKKWEKLDSNSVYLHNITIPANSSTKTDIIINDIQESEYPLYLVLQINELRPIPGRFQINNK